VKQAQIRGYMIPNDIKWVYDWFEIDATCPRDIQTVIDSLDPGEEIEVLVNSPGGAVTTGQEIFSMLQSCENSTAIVESEACSAASIAIMGAGRVIISPVGMIMIHNSALNGRISGDKNDFEKLVGMLTETDRAIASAYTYKTGMDEREILKLMNKETWLSAKQALALGFADEIKEPKHGLQMVAAREALPVTDKMIELAKLQRDQAEAKAKAEALEAQKNEILGDLFMYGI